MLPNPNLPKAECSSLRDDHAWAKQLCSELIAGCTLNIKLVKAGLWPKLLCEMTLGELAEYAVFVEGLGYSYTQAALARGH